MAHPAEEIERLALEQLHSAGDLKARARAGLSSRNIGSAFASIANNLPATAITINRAIGLGLDQEESDRTLSDLVSAYRENGIERYFVHVHPDARPFDIDERLRALGLEKARGWQKFSRGRDPVRSASTDLEIREATDEDGEAFARIVCAAFDLGEAAEPWIAHLPGHGNGWYVFMSFVDGEPAGAGCLFIDGDSAWTDFGATAPQYRKRGSQSALLSCRLQFALDKGCKQVFTCTGEEVPGDPQHSYANILRNGFREDYVRLNFAPGKD